MCHEVLGFGLVQLSRDHAGTQRRKQGKEGAQNDPNSIGSRYWVISMRHEQNVQMTVATLVEAFSVLWTSLFACLYSPVFFPTAFRFTPLDSTRACFLPSVRLYAS